MKKHTRILLHGIVWGVFILLLNTETLDLEWSAFDRKNGSLLIPLLYGTALGALVFYLNIHHFIPTYFGKENKERYWLYATGTVLGVSVLETVLDVLFISYQQYDLSQVQFKEEPASMIVGWLLMVFISALVPNVLCWILAFAFRLPKDWMDAEKQKNQLEKDKLQSELDFLKAQINPHFLFNGINSIYHLIGEDNKTAKSTLLQFSGLLRYQLYDCSGNYIALEKELDYISNYIQIEKVRKGEDAVFNINVQQTDQEESVKKLKIAPLIITPFLENAFKYLSHFSNREKNRVQLELTISASGILSMELSNSFDYVYRSKNDSSGGIGLANVKRRLNILYPKEKHRLELSNTEHVYFVKLTLDLNED